MADPPTPPGIPKLVLAVAGFFGFALPLVGVRAVTAEASMERHAKKSESRLAEQRVGRLLQPNLAQVTISMALSSAEEVRAATNHLTALGKDVERKKDDLNKHSKTLDSDIASTREFLKPFEGKDAGATEVDLGEPDKIGLVRTFTRVAQQLKNGWETLQKDISSPIDKEVGIKAASTLESLKLGVTELKLLSKEDLDGVKKSIENWERSELNELEPLPSTR